MLRVSLLGAQSIVDDAAGAVRVRSSRVMALAAYLIADAGVARPRQHIAALFWPETTDAQALTNLRRELHHLRQVLGAEAGIVVTSTHLCWRDTDACRVDVRTFDSERRAALAGAATGASAAVLEHAGRAIAQYQGDFLPGRYDDWVLELRSQLERQCVDLCDLVCQTRLRTGDLTGAVDVARRRIFLQPLEEVGYQTLMQLQSESGDRAGAVSTFHHCASVLERELGVDPGPATSAMLRRLLAQGRGAQAWSPRVEPPGVRSGQATAELFGRSPELHLLQECWRSAAAGQPSLVLVRGDAGVGKSRLVCELADLARRQGAVVASTQCFGTSRRLALSPVADWLRNSAVSAATATLDPVWRVEVDRLVPAASGATQPGVGARAMVDAWQRHRFFEGLSRALTRLGRPLLLVLDNLQWCDAETLEFLPFCLRLSSDAPVLVAATMRTGELDAAPESTGWIGRMRAAGGLTEVPLAPLEAADTARLAAAICGRPLHGNEAEVLQATTGGFPLYVVEAARTMVDSASTSLPVGSLRAVLHNRFEQVTPAARVVAGLAAAVGRNFSLDLLTEASDLDPDAVVQAVDELWRRRILRESRDGYDFSHDLLRESAYSLITPPKRWLSHRRLAQSLELLHAEDTDAVSAQLAEQCARGGRPQQAATFYRRAADIAAGRFAHAEAIRLHKEALNVVDTLPAGASRDRQELDVLEALAAPLNARDGYSSRELQATLERSIVLAESLGRQNSVLTALVGLWTSQFVHGDLDAGHATVTRALRLAEPDSELSGPAHFAFGGSAVSRGLPALALRHFELAAALTRGQPSLSVGSRPDVHGLAWAAHAQWLLGRDDLAKTRSREAIELARTIEHPYSLAVALAYGAVTYQLCGDCDMLRDTVAELRQLCDRYGFAYYREWGLVIDGWCRGSDPGLGLIAQGIGNLKADGSFARMPYWLALQADALARSGRPHDAAATLDAALVDGRARNDVWWLPEVMRMRATYDRETAALARLRAGADMAAQHGSVALLRRCEHDLAERGVEMPATTGSALH